MPEVIRWFWELVITKNPPVTNDLMNYLFYISRRYGLLYGFNTYNGNQNNLKEFILKLPTKMSVEDLALYCEIYLYFKYPIYVQTRKDAYDQSEVLAETIWNDIEQSGKFVMDAGLFNSLIGKYKSELLEYLGLKIKKESDGMVTLVPK